MTTRPVRKAVWARVASAATLGSLIAGCTTPAWTPEVRGIVWQLHEASSPPKGTWEKLGAREVLLQWIVVDDTAFVPKGNAEATLTNLEWQQVSDEPWARRGFIVGLAGRMNESEGRAEVENLILKSAQLAELELPFRVSGWYFPVEVDPTWVAASEMGPLLARLPRPLWISVYDRGNIGGGRLAEWLDSWLPSDVGVLFQDGVGLWARTPDTAKNYADALSSRLGKKRVRIIAEAFRERADGSLRPAEPEELREQLRSYVGWDLYLFEGPSYVDEALVEQLTADH